MKNHLIAAMLIGSSVYGDTWLSHADPFEAST